jgi:hypothetical protein
MRLPRVAEVIPLNYCFQYSLSESLAYRTMQVRQASYFAAIGKPATVVGFSKEKY